MSDAAKEKVQELAELIDRLERQGCGCDLLYGVRCSIHETAREAHRVLGDVRVFAVHA